MASVCQCDAKINPEKIKKSLIGSWSFYKEFCYKPSNWTMSTRMDVYYREGNGICQINRTFHFYKDGRCEIKSLNESKCEKVNAVLSWELGTIDDAQGDERAALFIRAEDSDFGGIDLDEYDTQDSNKTIVIMIMEAKDDRLILSKKSENGVLDGNKVKDVWFNYYKRYINY
jgi:hypothetical protein